MTKGKTKILSYIAVICIVILILALLQRLLMPKYMHGIVEGAMIAEYYNEPKDHDVVFIGDCELYENISPQVLWDEYGINSYIRGSAQQLIWQSYYLMEETLKYEHPDIIVFNVLSMQYNTPQSEAYNRMTLDGMKLSKEKLSDISASMTDGENAIEYLFPILRYHSRITQLEPDDITYFWNRDKVTLNGYYMRTDIKAAENVPIGRPLGNYTFGDTAYYYLEKMTKLCADEGVTLVLVKAPTLYPYWYDEWDEQIVEFANEHNLSYYNFLDESDDIGLDFSTDTYDGGLHLNLYGAEKLSRYFGEILRDDFDMASRRGEEALEAEWDENRKEYEAKITEQGGRLK